jgi:poly-gamma-glutamate synthesis protein (capsule biosynthesis protein)
MGRRGLVLFLGLFATLSGVTTWLVFMPRHAHSPVIALPTAPPTETKVQSNPPPMVTIDQALQSSASAPLAQLDSAKLRTIITTGDVIPARGVDAQIRKNGPNFPFGLIGNLLSDADLTIVNLESPLIDNCPPTNTGFTFCGQSSFAGAMATAGIDVATLENNHITNYAVAGKLETIQHLTKSKVAYATDAHLAIEMIRGLKVGILAFNGVGGRFDRSDIQQEVASARPQVDLLLVAFHWGKEYELEPQADPTIAPDSPVEIGHLAVDAGADLVIGNHPHWVQGIEIYKGKFISYALGNFIFDQSWSETTQQGMVAKYTYFNTTLVKVEYFPIHIYHQAQPELAAGSEKSQILQQLSDSTKGLK